MRFTGNCPTRSVFAEDASGWDFVLAATMAFRTREGPGRGNRGVMAALDLSHPLPQSLIARPLSRRAHHSPGALLPTSRLSSKLPLI